MYCENIGEDDRSIHLQVLELQKLEEARGSSETVLDYRNSVEKGDSGETADAASVSSAIAFHRSTSPAPEQKLTLFALRLAIIEKIATNLGTLGFIWATVVLLGGFAITLEKSDFWFITIILLIEGTRIFSRSHELEWQHQATWTVSGVGISSFRVLQSSSISLLRNLKRISDGIFKPILDNGLREATTRIGRQEIFDRRTTLTWKNSEVPLLPYARWLYISSYVSRILYWLQLLSASACVALSSYKLVMHNYGDVQDGDLDKRNRQAALSIFYSLALAEALLFLAEKAYWEWEVSVCHLLENVTRECGFGVTGMVSIKRFFYDAYSKSVNGSIFDGVKMDMVSFAMDLLGSNCSDEQLIGARILRQFAVNERFAEDTLEKIGINLPVIERLVEMLNWKDLQEEEIRRSAAEILSKLAGKKQNSLRVAGISGAMESISSLLQNTRSLGEAPDEIGEKKLFHDHHLHYDFWRFNNLGLLILKKLSRDHDNCGKIGNTRGLLPKIIDFTHTDATLLKDENADMVLSRVLTVKRSLQLVKMLVSTSGNTGKCLRREISEIVFTISNLRDVLRHGVRYPKLQKLGIEILSFLALETDGRERIAVTGGVLKELFSIFLKSEAIGMLALESRSNCIQILKLGVFGRLVEALEVPLIRVNAARVLRNLCIYSGHECFLDLRFIKTAAPTVLKSITSGDNKLLEVMLGLAAQVFKFMSSEEANIVLTDSGIKKQELANSLVSILKKHDKPAIKVPRIRRFVIELAIWMMEDDVENVGMFRDLGMEKELVKVLETTAELENFDVFSGTVGVSRQSRTVHWLAELALKMLEDEHS
ncbi:putative armadillo-like helical protein [Arabidopsis thaliana]